MSETTTSEATKQIAAFNASREHLRMTAKQFPPKMGTGN